MKKIKIIKRPNCCGNVVNVGDVCDTKFIPARELAVLLNCQCAIPFDDVVETAEAKPTVETAESKRGRKRK